MDELRAAFGVFLQEVGARIADHMGGPEETNPPTPEALREATRTLIRLSNEMDDGPAADPDEPEQLAVVQQETLAQAFEDAWDSFYSEKITVPAKRAALLRFFEEQAGRKLNLAEDPGVDPPDVSEMHIAFIEGAARAIVEGSPVRCYSLNDDGIFLETVQPLIVMAYADNPFVRSDELDTDDLASLLARWKAEPQIFLANQDDKRNGATGRYFVDTAMRESNPEGAQALRDMTGGGNVRTREAMLADPQHPGLAQAMLAWEQDDDSLFADIHRAWAERVIEAAPEARELVR